MVRQLKELLRLLGSHIVFKIVIAVCAAVICAMAFYSASPLHAAANISLNYEGASDGLYINGTRLNMYDIEGEAIMGKAIKDAGLEGVLDIDELAGWLDIAPRYTSSPKNGYIGTEYILTLDCEEYYGVSAHDLLGLICNAFADSVRSSYLGSRAVVTFTAAETNGLDYGGICGLFETKIDLLSSYLNKRDNENGSFKAEATGESFSSLLERLSDIENISLEKLRAYVNNNGLTNNKSSSLALLDYQARQLKRSYDQLMIHYNVMLDTVSDYDLSQTAVLLVPAYDAKSELYMSRTQTGVDYFTDEANTYLTESAQVLDRLKDNEQLSSNISSLADGGSGYSALCEKADSLIEALESSLESFSETVAATDDEYVAQQVNGSLLAQYQHFYDISVDSLYSRILSGAAAKDPELLVEKYNAKLRDNLLRIETLENKIGLVDKLIESYISKSEAYLETDGESGTASRSYILDVLAEDYNGAELTTYDGLMTCRADYTVQRDSYSLENEYYEYLLGVFKDAKGGASDEIDNTIKDITASSDDLYDTLCKTIAEFNDYTATSHIRVDSGISVAEGMNVKLYTLIALVFFLFIGVACTTVFGRLSEIIEHRLYTDEKTGLPNRAGFDRELERMAEPLPGDTVCVACELANLREVNEKLGREYGDLLLKNFGLIASNVSAGYGELTYNGGAAFVGIFKSCTLDRGEYFVNSLREAVERYNNEYPDTYIEIVCTAREANAEKLYSARDLLKRTLAALRLECSDKKPV